MRLANPPKHGARLLVFYANVDPSRVKANVCEVCGGEISPMPEWKREDGGLLSLTFELPLARLAGVRKIVPSFSCTTKKDYTFQFLLQVRQGGREYQPWHRLSKIGTKSLGLDSSLRHPESDDQFVNSDIDFFFLKTELEQARIKLLVATPDVGALRTSPCIVSLSLSPELIGDAGPQSPLEGSIEIPVPTKCQMIEDPCIRRRVCSPTSVSMVLDYLGAQSDVSKVAEKSYNSEHDMYGIWPANIWAASTWGILGYLLRVPSWECVRALLLKRIPIVASVRYEKGELTNAAIEETPGHLITIRGFSGAFIKVNDPAAASIGEVPREYLLEELDKVWLKRKGVGYILFSAS